MRTKAILVAALAVAAGCGTDAPGLPGGGDDRVDLPPVAKYDQQRQPTRVTVEHGVGGEGAGSGWSGPDLRRSSKTPGLEASVYARADSGGVVLPGPSARRLGEDTAPDPRAQGYQEGELCTYDAAAWATPCGSEPASPGCLLKNHFVSLFPDGIVLGRAEKHFVLTGVQAVEAALPAEGTATRLTEDEIDPVGKDANRLAAELAVLRLNIAFNQQALIGTAELDGATLLVGPFQGWSIAHLAELAESALDNDNYRHFGVDIDREAFADELAVLNSAAPGCVPDDILSRVSP